MVGVAGGVRNSSYLKSPKTGGGRITSVMDAVSLSVDPTDPVAGCRQSVAGRRQSPVNAPRIDDRRRCGNEYVRDAEHASGGCGGRKIGTTSPENVRCIGETQKKYFFGDERRMDDYVEKTYVSSVQPRNRDSVRESLWRAVCFSYGTSDTICLAWTSDGVEGGRKNTLGQILKTDSRNYDILSAMGAQCTEKSTWRIHDGTGRDGRNPW